MEPSKRSSFGQNLERILWNTRWAVLFSVVCSILASLLMFYIAAVDTYYVMDLLLNYNELDSPMARGVVRGEAVGMVVKIIDVFLLAIVLIIFGLGMYELYISKIDHAYENNDESAKHMLSVSSLDDLKSRLGKVIMMVLIVKFFEMAISMELEGIEDLLVFSGGTLLIGATLYLTEQCSRKKGEWKTRKADFEEESERKGSIEDRAS